MASTLAEASSLAKIWRGTYGNASSAAAKQASVTAIVIQRIRMAPTRIERNARRTKLGLAAVASVGVLRSQTPSSGANRTATNQETMSAIVTTAKIENVYSPA